MALSLRKALLVSLAFACTGLFTGCITCCGSLTLAQLFIAIGHV